MNYILDIPANTTEAVPLKQSFDIGRPLIKRMEVHIPDGHKYLAHFQMRSRGRILIPEFGSSILWLEGNGNNVLIVPPFPIVIDGPPYEITLIGWNEDDTYTHAFHLEIN